MNCEIHAHTPLPCLTLEAFCNVLLEEVLLSVVFGFSTMLKLHFSTYCFNTEELLGMSLPILAVSSVPDLI